MYSDYASQLVCVHLCAKLAIGLPVFQLYANNHLYHTIIVHILAVTIPSFIIYVVSNGMCNVDVNVRLNNH